MDNGAGDCNSINSIPRRHIARAQNSRNLDLSIYLSIYIYVLLLTHVNALSYAKNDKYVSFCVLGFPRFSYSLWSSQGTTWSVRVFTHVCQNHTKYAHAPFLYTCACGYTCILIAHTMRVQMYMCSLFCIPSLHMSVFTFGALVFPFACFFFQLSHWCYSLSIVQEFTV